MKIILNICLFLFVSFSVQAQTVINFDDLAPSGGDLIPNPYQDWTWMSTGDMFYLTGTSLLGSGYDNGTTSSPNVAYNGFGTYPITITFEGLESCIDLTSLSLSSAWENGMVISIDGMKGGGVTQSTGNIVLNSSGPNTFDPDLKDIDAIVINLVAPGIDQGLGGSGQHLVIDDFTWGACSNIVPTLGEWSVICLGLLLAIFGAVSVVQRKTVLG